MEKKIWMGAIAVFLVLAVAGFVIHGVLLKSIYMSMSGMVRSEAEMNSNMWIIFVVNAIVAYFATLVFSKGYENKGIAEGVRYGLYIGLIMSTPMAYSTYASMPIPYSLALQWFLYGIVEWILCGVALAMVFKQAGKTAAS